MPINGHTLLAGVIGCPVSHSRSPLLHNYWCQKYHINAAYLPLPVEVGNLETALKGLAASGFCGVNVTIPHKEEAFSLCHILTERAQKAGAVNTLIFKEDGLWGDSTDGAGFYENLRASHGPEKGNCLILGAGGAARALASFLSEKGFSIFISNRTRVRAERLIKALGYGEVLDWEAYPQTLHKMDLLINATSLGMGKEINAQEEHYWRGVFTQRCEEQERKLTIADTVYTPLETSLLRIARQKNYHVIEGLGMLLYQACEGFFQWFGVRPEVDEDVFSLLKRDLGL